jgi:phage-related protein
MYYSEVFGGVRSDLTKYESGFATYVRSNHDGRGSASCFQEKESGSAKEKLDQNKMDTKRLGYTVEQTDWKYAKN